MNTLIHADVFFFVSTICLVVFAILGIVAWVFVIKILANLKTLSDKARIEGEFILEEVGDLRDRIHEQTFGMRPLFRFIRHIVGRYR